MKKEIVKLASDQASDDISTDGSALYECKHKWHTACWFGPNPFPDLEGWEVHCEHCNQWAFQEAVEVDDCEWQPFGEPIIFDMDTINLIPIEDTDEELP